MREMKNSGTPWIGEIPADWSLIRFKDKYKSIKEIARERSSEYERLALTLNGVIKRPKDDSEGLQPKEFDTYQILEEGDFVFKMIDLQNISTSRVGLSPYTGLVSPAYIRFTPKSKDQYNKFVYYYLMSLYYNCVYNNLGGNGVRSALNATDMAEFIIPYPSEDTQKHICDFLDSQCSKVDALIANVESQIEKLKAYKQSLISEIITRGLDLIVPTKDSEILWFGNIPNHWNIAKIKLFASTCSGGTPPSGDLTCYDGDINWACSFDLHEEEIYETGKTLSEKGASLIAGEMQSPNSILIAMYGGAGTIGNSGLLQCYARTNQAICSVHFDEANVYPRYAFYQMMFLRKHWMYFAAGTRKDPNISQDVVRNMKFVIPPIEEQEQIAAYLDTKCSVIKKLIDTKEQKISRLIEYKKSLIYEYVTGKKEVM